MEPREHSPLPRTLAVVMGRREESRLRAACRMANGFPNMFDVSLNIDTLLIEGYGAEYGEDYSLALDDLCTRPYNLRHRDDLTVVIQGPTANCKTQSEWLAQEIAERAIGSLFLLAPPYHIARAYLTLLASLIKKGLHTTVRVYPMTTDASPFKIIPADDQTPIDLFQGEVDRIIRYQETGDVATWPEFQEYLRWFYS